MAPFSRVLYVSGFSASLRARDLAYEFERYGRLIRCDIPALKSASSSPFAFVEFRREDDAEDAYYDMRISVQWAKRPPSAAWRHDGYTNDQSGRGSKDPQNSAHADSTTRNRSLSPRRNGPPEERRRSPSPHLSGSFKAAETGASRDRSKDERAGGHNKGGGDFRDTGIENDKD
ncbi:hypothetical protein IAT38_006121 [Cryptococcus sp. DSM 104549]